VFDGIVVSGTEKMIKPDKQFFQVLLDRYKLQAEHSLFIDDNAKNIKAAEEMGFTTIHLKEDTRLQEEIKNLGL
jgi:2-haloacid dehalogenase